MSVIRAAGGVLRRTRRGRIEVAVIHRPVHDDWSLPKGKLRDGEPSWRGAAREVQEETACAARLDAYAGTVSYVTKDRQKLVAFWHMAVVEEGEFAPNDEVDRLEWLPIAAAMKRLDHEGEQELLARAMNGREAPVKSLSWWRRWMVRSAEYRAQTRRLRAELATARTDMEPRIAAADSDDLWVSTAQRHLVEAEQALLRGDVDLGYPALLAARRAEIYGLSAEQRRDRALALRMEAAEKLTNWRRGAVLQLLRSARISAEQLAYATELRDENAQNEYHTIALLQEQFGWLTAVVGAAIGATVLTVIRNGLPLGDLSAYEPWDVVRFVMLFGILGGSLSGMYSLMRARTRARIPARVAAAVVTLSRPLAGAAAAVVSYVILQAQLFDAILAPSVRETGAGVLAVAFLAGMSERFVLRVVQERAGGAAGAAPPGQDEAAKA